MATIIKTDAGTYKAIAPNNSEPEASKIFNKKGEVICRETTCRSFACVISEPMWNANNP